MKWYSSVTRYQWLVLIVASLGWVFDAFEGQIYTMTRADMLPDILKVAPDDPLVKVWGERLLAVFLIGGTLGGLLFSSLADKWGRNPVMALTILFYSVFSGLTVYASEIWQVGALRFLVAMGVGGEWAVGAALVAEVFPKEARERAGGIFHATSVCGLWLATAASRYVGTDWRMAYLLGVLPALLVLWVRISIKEPDAWKEAQASKAERMGSFGELLGDARWRARAVFGALLAMVGLATFWGVVIAGQDIAADFLKKAGDPDWSDKAKVAFGIIQTAGAGAGMLAFGPLSARWGCKKTFVVMHLSALVMTPVVCWLPSQAGSYTLLLVLLPVFGFFAQGIHAGYAAYFPALFPTHLRATGSGFCFNTGRLLAAPVLFWLSAWMKSAFDLRVAVTCLGGFFLMGLFFLACLPETRGEELPE
jgi:MFS family permease